MGLKARQSEKEISHREKFEKRKERSEKIGQANLARAQRVPYAKVLSGTPHITLSASEANGLSEIVNVEFDHLRIFPGTELTTPNNDNYFVVSFDSEGKVVDARGINKEGVRAQTGDATLGLDDYVNSKNTSNEKEIRMLAQRPEFVPMLNLYNPEDNDLVKRVLRQANCAIDMEKVDFVFVVPTNEQNKYNVVIYGNNGQSAGADILRTITINLESESITDAVADIFPAGDAKRKRGIIVPYRDSRHKIETLFEEYSKTVLGEIESVKGPVRASIKRRYRELVNDIATEVEMTSAGTQGAGYREIIALGSPKETTKSLLKDYPVEKAEELIQFVAEKRLIFEDSEQEYLSRAKALVELIHDLENDSVEGQKEIVADYEGLLRFLFSEEHIDETLKTADTLGFIQGKVEKVKTRLEKALDGEHLPGLSKIDHDIVNEIKTDKDFKQVRNYIGILQEHLEMESGLKGSLIVYSPTAVKGVYRKVTLVQAGYGGEPDLVLGQEDSEERYFIEKSKLVKGERDFGIDAEGVNKLLEHYKVEENAELEGVELSEEGAKAFYKAMGINHIKKKPVKVVLPFVEECGVSSKAFGEYLNSFIASLGEAGPVSGFESNYRVADRVEQGRNGKPIEIGQLSESLSLEGLDFSAAYFRSGSEPAAEPAKKSYRVKEGSKRIAYTVFEDKSVAMHILTQKQYDNVLKGLDLVVQTSVGESITPQ